MASSEILVPGEDLQRASDSMNRVLQHIDVSRGSGDLDAAVGAPVRDAAENFEKRWGDGREQLHRECEKIIEAIKKIEDSFTSIDNQSAASLGSN